MLEYPDYLTEMALPIAGLECYNSSSNSAWAEDWLLQGGLREMWWLAATQDVQLTIRHKPRGEMVVPDMSNRVGISRSHRANYDKFVNFTSESRLLVQRMSDYRRHVCKGGRPQTSNQKKLVVNPENISPVLCSICVVFEIPMKEPTCDDNFMLNI